MRDNVNYQETGALTILDWSARHAEEMLRNFYRTGYNSWRKGSPRSPAPSSSPRTRPTGCAWPR